MRVWTRGGRVFKPTARSSLFAPDAIVKLCAVVAARALGVRSATRKNIRNAFRHGKKNKIGEMTNNPLTPKEIYDSYPAADLLAVDPPETGETFHDYINRQGKQQIRECGDTLFAFMIFELADAGNRDEAIHMLDRALDDVLSVRRAIDK